MPVKGCSLLAQSLRLPLPVARSWLFVGAICLPQGCARPAISLAGIGSVGCTRLRKLHRNKAENSTWVCAFHFYSALGAANCVTAVYWVPNWGGCETWRGRAVPAVVLPQLLAQGSPLPPSTANQLLITALLPVPVALTLPAMHLAGMAAAGAAPAAQPCQQPPAQLASLLPRRWLRGRRPALLPVCRAQPPAAAYGEAAQLQAASAAQHQASSSLGGEGPL